MRHFHHWAHNTLAIELNAAKEIKELRNELNITKHQVTMFAADILDDDQISKLTPEEAETILQER